MEELISIARYIYRSAMLTVAWLVGLVIVSNLVGLIILSFRS